MARIPGPIPAICVPVLGHAQLEDRDGTSTGSDYSEGGPRPGIARADDPRARAVPIVSSEQAVDLELLCVRQGSPQLGDASCQLAYREPGGDLFGWTAPNRFVGFSGAAIQTNDPADGPSGIVTCPRSQRVVVVAPGATVNWESHRWSPWERAFEDVVELGDDGAGAPGAALVAEPAGRLLWIAGGGAAYRSDDDGASWELHALDLFADGTTLASTTSATAAASVADGCVIFGSATDWQQRVTVDRFASLSLVAEDTRPGEQPSIVALPGGGYLVAYLDEADSYPRVRRIATASESVFLAETIEVEDVDCSSLVLAMDPDGMLWLVGATDDGGDKIVRAWVSQDGGLTWAALEDRAYQSADRDEVLDLRGAASAEGVLHVLIVCGAGSNDGSLGVMRFGGWDNRTAPTSGRGVSDRRGSCDPSDVLAAIFVPTSLPASQGWTDTGAGSAAVGSEGRLQVTTTAGLARYFTWSDAGYEGSVTVAFEVLPVTNGGTSSDDIACRIRAGSTADTWGAQVSIRFADDGTVEVYDGVDAAVVASVVLDVDEGPIQIRAFVNHHVTNGPFVTVEYRQPGTEAWASLAANVSVGDNGGPVADAGVTFGAITTGGSEARWGWVHVYTHMAISGGSIAGGSLVGRPVSTLPAPLGYETGPSDAGPARLSVSTGPAFLGESWSAPARHDYPASALDPTVSPSPSQGWRGVEDGPVVAETVFAYDLGERAWIGDAVALAVCGANFRLAALEYYDAGSSTWTEVASLDLATGFYGLTYRLRGRTVTPEPGTLEGARYIQEGELVGGWMLITVEGDPDKFEPETFATGRKIIANSAGTWGGSGPQVRIELDPDGLTGGEQATAGCGLVWPSGVLVWYPEADEDGAGVAHRRWRVRLPEQACPDHSFRAGILTVCQAHALGAPTDWGWSRERLPNAETRRSRSGTTRTVRLGKALRQYTAGWAASGLPQFDLRGDDPGADWLGLDDDHAPLVAAQDVAWKLEGLLETTRSGAVPIVWIPHLPTPASGDYTTITDPTLWLYGRWLTSARADHEVGDEIAGGAERVASVTIEEIG